MLFYWLFFQRINLIKKTDWECYLVTAITRTARVIVRGASRTGPGPGTLWTALGIGMATTRDRISRVVFRILLRVIRHFPIFRGGEMFRVFVRVDVDRVPVLGNRDQRRFRILPAVTSVASEEVVWRRTLKIKLKNENKKNKKN
jgi:hypothetical protein